MKEEDAMNKRSLPLLLLALAVTAVAAAGCQGTPAERSGFGEEGEAAAKASPYPAVLSYWVPMNANVAATMDNFAEIGVYREMERLTGTKIDFQHSPMGQDKDQFHLMIASGKLPDVIEYSWSGVTKGPDNAIKEKRIIRLNELVEKHATNLSKVLRDNPEFRQLALSDEGNLYMFPSFTPDPGSLVYNGLAIREDWLDRLGLPMPATLPEWERTLTAFRDMDPNGNGRKDEIPLLLDLKVMNTGHAFIGAYGMTTGFYNDSGEVKYGPVDPRFKDFLTVMNRWYKEGLIDKDFATFDQRLKDAKMTEGIVGAMAMNIGYGIGTYTAAMEKVDPAFRLEGAPYPSLEPGGTSIGQKAHSFNGRGVAISASAAQPEKIVRWLDYAYGEAGQLLFNFGIEGESYTLKDGYPTFSDTVANHPDKLGVGYAMTRYARGAFSGPYISDKRFNEQYMSMPQQKRAVAVWSKADHARLLPPLTQNSAESVKITAMMNDIHAYYEDMVNKFIMGVEPLEQFGNFTTAIRRMGIDEVLRMKQAAFDRFMLR